MNKDDFRKAFQAAVQSVLDEPQEPIGDTETFSNYGLDSLDIMNMLLAIEDEVGADIGEVEVQGTDNFETLYEACKSKL